MRATAGGRGRWRRPPGVLLLGAALAAVLAWLVGYPLLVTLLEALRGPAGWTLEGFRAFSERPDEWLALWRSVWISVASVVLSAAVGVPLAFLFERAEFPGRRLLGALVALPVALPPLVGVIAFLFLYGESGFVSRAVQAAAGLDAPPWRLVGAWAILLVHTYSMYVYFYLFTRAALARLDPAHEEAAASLGAGRLRTLLRVTLPMLRPALAGAAMLTFMTSLASFSAPYIFGGSFRVMTTQITASKLNGDDLAAQVETIVLALAALAGLWLFTRMGGLPERGGAVRGVAPARRRIASAGGRTAAAAGGWAFAALLLLPHLTLVLISLVPPGTWTAQAVPPVLDLSNYRAFLDHPERLRPVVNSLWMAGTATLAALALGLAAARAASGLKRRAAARAATRGGTGAPTSHLGRALEGLLALPWAIPGTVFAIALATTFSVAAPWAGRVVLVGTPWILPLAYLVRSLPLTGRSAVAGLAQVDPALEEAAASLGAGGWRTLRRVVLPLLRPALAAGASLAFITAVGDFVVSIVLYTLDTRPISIEILSSLRVQDLGAAAVYGVLLATASAAAFLLWGEERRDRRPGAGAGGAAG
ncbi:MAG TPA: iron ABC transporter permease [Thermoanaerobaculia bacterium]|nr:iron ABC transporter permease [Thermoanaerobaculia bacterium]